MPDVTVRPVRARLSGAPGARADAPSLVRTALVGTAAGTAMVVGGMVGGTAFVNTLPGAWFFGPSSSAPASPAPPPSAVSILLVYGGLVVLVRCWIRLWRGLPPGRPVGRVAAVLAAWSVPFLVAPPLFSRDLYSYAGLGEMVSHHINPYLFGTGVLGGTPFSMLAGTFWANTPSPYGPTYLGLDGLITDVTGHHVLADLALLRLVAAAGVVLAGVGIVALARSYGRDPARALVLGVGSPLVLTTLIGGGHNDALMAGLLLVGLAAARRFGPVPGILLCALAAGVKAPALLGVVFIGWNWPGPGARWTARAGRTAMAGVMAGVVLAVLSTATGLGWGWLRTLGAANKVFTGITPVNAVARVIRGAGLLVHLDLSLGGLHTAVALVALAAAGGLGVWLLLRSPQLGLELALGMTLLVLALAGPILWGWYLTWGLLVLAPVARGRVRTVVAVVTVAGAAIAPTAVKTVGSALVASPLWADVAVLAAVAALCLVPLGLDRPGSDTTAPDHEALSQPGPDGPTDGRPGPSDADGRRRPGDSVLAPQPVGAD